MEKEIDEITAKLEKANRAYYQEDKPIMSDSEYDKLKHKLMEIAKETNRHFDILDNVGYKVLDKFEKVEHKIPMISLNHHHHKSVWLFDFLNFPFLMGFQHIFLQLPLNHYELRLHQQDEYWFWAYRNVASHNN